MAEENRVATIVEAPKDVVQRVSKEGVSLRIEGALFDCPANQVTTHFWKLPDNYRIRGAEFQMVNAKAGDFVELWITDHDGAVYPVDTRLTKYIPRFYCYEHSAGAAAPIVNLVDEDSSDEVPSIFYIEFKYTNAQASGPDVRFICNFWMYLLV